AFALIEDNIYTTQSPELANLRRRQLRHTFTHTYLEPMEPIVLERGVAGLMRRWDRLLALSVNGTAVVVQYEAEFARLAIDVIVALGYGQNPDMLGATHVQIARWVHDYNMLSMVNLILPAVCTRWPLTLFTRSLLQSKRDFAASVHAAAAARRTQLQSNKQARPIDILQALLDGEDPQSKAKMTATQVVAENIAIIVASTDIVAQTLTWTLGYLMLYPETYRRATDEVRGFPRHSLITHADAKTRLPYTEACVYEAMRIRAATGVFLPRVVPKGGAIFQGHYLPAGTELGVNVAGANHHQSTWENPRRFMPERFIDNAERSKQNLFTFSLGARMCPGKNLALFEILPVIANMLKNYDFALPPDALFTPDRLDKYGNPVAMPRLHRFTSVGPKYPDCDCRIIVSKAAEY
ncbi:hypothetical protein GGI20_003608, partial [Coemansia sp. BCRC 34301]